MTRHRKTIAATLAAAGLLLIAIGQFGVRVDAAPPVPLSQLGLIVDHSEQAEPIASAMPRFFVVGAEAQDNALKNVRLWDFTKLANGGEHLPNYPQETGDCVAFGAKNAAEYFTYAAVGKGTLDAEGRLVSPLPIYGGSRVTVGKGRLGRSPGSVGAWAADWVGQYGVLPADTEGLPRYSGRVADEWGVKGVPRQFVEASKQWLFSTVAPVYSANDVRDAICNGYPVTIASDFGTKTIKVKDGRRVAVRNGRWFHQMCIVGYDGSASEPYFYVLNSWGPSAHPAPMQGEPPGGFWITQADCEYIVRQRDSFAFSGFDGFPANEFVPDFSVIGQAGPEAAALQIEEVHAMFPISPELSLPLTILGGALLAAAVVLLLWGNRRGRTVAGAAALMLAAMMATAPIAAAEEFSPNFGMVVTAATGGSQSFGSTETSGPSPASESTAGTAEYVPDFALLAKTANAPHEVGGIRASTPTEPPAVDFSVLIKAAHEKCRCETCDCADCDGVNCRCGKPSGAKPAETPQAQQKLLNASGVMIQASAKTPGDSLIATLDGIRDRPRLVAGVANPTRQQAVQHLLTAANHRGKFTAEQLALLTDQQILELHEADHDRMEGRPTKPAASAVTFATHEGQAARGQVFIWTDGSSRNVPQPGKDYLTVGLRAKREQPQTVRQPAPQQVYTSQQKSRGIFSQIFRSGPRCVGGVCYQ